ncbi:MAG: hypothetical protein HC806_04325 [Anaerolineae bacterium]|nr:hypothetical protein [Anaerolineae bacterium]
MSPAAFKHQITHIKTFYQRTDQAVQDVYKRDFKYLTKTQMDQFVDDAVSILMQAYQLLEEELPEGHTILDARAIK